MSFLAHQLDIEMPVSFCFVFSSVSVPSSFFSYLIFDLVLSCRPSVGPSTGHIMGLIVPANSNPVPSGLSLRPERIWFRFLSFLFVFFSFLFICVSFLCTLLLVCFSGVRVICVTDMFLVLRISLRVIRDGVPQLASTVPLSTGTAVHVLFCFLPSRGFSYCRLACDHGLDFREMSY